MSEAIDTPGVEGLLTTEKLAAILDVPESTVTRWRGTGYGPRAIKVGKHVRYRASDVDAWLQQQAARAGVP